jgi:hypothetical protein
VAAYGGWLWLARMAGVRGWQAHAPAILYATAPYVLTNINVRQDLTEFVATAVIPLLLASALSVLRADRLRAGPAAALAVSTVFFAGSHNLTLLWGTTILLIAAPVVAVAVPQVRSHVTRHGVLRVLAVVVPAMAVNAWYLLPDLAYHADTVIANRIDEWQALLRGYHPELDAWSLFAPGHSSPFADSGFSITLPVLAMAWVIVAALVSRAEWRAPWGRMLAVLLLLTVGVLVVMGNPRWILALPDPWTMIQFSYRLETFALFGICGAVIAALVLLKGGGRQWAIRLLLPILAFSVINANLLRHDAPRGTFAPLTTIDAFRAFNVGDFADGRLIQHPVEPGAKGMTIERGNLHGGRVSDDVRVMPGAILYTNLLTPPRMLDVQGARIIGRWPAPPLAKDWQDRWGLVLQVDPSATAGKVHIVIREARSLPIVAGRIISIFGLLGLAAIAAVIGRAAWRRRSG